MNAKISQFPAPNKAADVIDIDLGVTNKKKVRFNGDDSRMVEINVSDMNILDRLNTAYPKLHEQVEKVTKLGEGVELNKDTVDADAMGGIQTISERLREIDASMRELVDYIFNAPVSAAAAPDGSMYDPFNGSFRFEHIIAALVKQYENNMQAEFAKMERQINKHAAKYTKGQ